MKPETVKTEYPSGEGIRRPARPARWAWFFAVLTATGGSLLSAALWRESHASERSRLIEEFRIEAENLKARAEAEISLFEEVLDSIGRLHSLSDQISADDFNEFVGKGMLHQRRILGAFGFAQRIEESVRMSLENPSLAAEGRPLSILEADGAGGFRAAGRRPEYYFLTYQVPEKALGVPIGYDFGSSPVDAAAISDMLETGRISLGGGMPLAEAGADVGWFVFAPILYPTIDALLVAAPGYLYGFVVSIIHPDEMIDRAFSGRRPEHVSAAIEAAPSGAGDERVTPPAVLFPGVGGAAIAFEAGLRIAGRAGLFRYAADAVYVRAHRSGQPSAILAVGLILTALVTGQLVFMAGSTRRIQKVVRARTAELRESHERLAGEMAERLRLEGEILEIGSREKQHVGQDLHDSLGQKLAGAVYLSRALLGRLSEADSEARENAARINETLKESMAQVRRIARGLAPVDIGEDGLSDALKRLAEEVSATYPIVCRFEIQGEARVQSRKTAEHLFHIAQEAVSNAVRHGHPETVWILLSAAGDRGRLVVEDDGAGLPVEARQGKGLGLRIMKYRSEVIGGFFDLSRNQHGGVVVTCRFDPSKA